jgi:hypothetical protein
MCPLISRGLRLSRVVSAQPQRRTLDRRIGAVAVMCKSIAPGSREFVLFFLPGNSHPPKWIAVLPSGSNAGRMVWTVAGCPSLPKPVGDDSKIGELTILRDTTEGDGPSRLGGDPSGRRLCRTRDSGSAHVVLGDAGVPESWRMGHPAAESWRQCLAGGG